ncbi:MAG: hypothetical protein HN645_15665 [Gemmatimonadales bacterium]|jgi:acetolactate synthase-1/2/3 large subunit|nr:hypothetical protein [Gemmatimonadales bacterium]MBT6373472.1 hypothetical protein [Gemmatimonadales bacterium]MBT7123876.1 hypothetical protein [Gemmatimonadales bacterium]MBT7504359.1 hypothetical protein [Gemmatimonadales bacterium]
MRAGAFTGTHGFAWPTRLFSETPSKSIHNLVPGTGLTHAMSGIAEAFMDHVAMLVLGCGIRRDVRRAFQLHDVDQQGIARPMVKQIFLPIGGS